MYTYLDDTYYQRMVGAILATANSTDEGHKAEIHEKLIRFCPECAEVEPDAQLHRMYAGYVLICCEGYYTMDPALVGMGSGNWMDFRDQDID